MSHSWLSHIEGRAFVTPKVLQAATGASNVSTAIMHDPRCFAFVEVNLVALLERQPHHELGFSDIRRA